MIKQFSKGSLLSGLSQTSHLGSQFSGSLGFGLRGVFL